MLPIKLRRQFNSQSARPIGLEGVLLTPPPYPPLSSLESASDVPPWQQLSIEVAAHLDNNLALSPELLSRAHQGIVNLSRDRLGGTFWGCREPSTIDGKRLILLAPADRPGDQGETASRTDHMIRAAQGMEHARIFVLTHGLPTSHRRRYETAAKRHGWTVVDKATDPWHLIEQADSVLTNGAIIGFLALLANIDVKCFQDCFYSGWGITDDCSAISGHPVRRSREELFAAAVLLSPRYTDPIDNQPLSFEQACAILVEWRRLNDANRSIVACLGMSFWKRRRIKEMLRSTDGLPIFYRSTKAALHRAQRLNGEVAVWASREPVGLETAARVAKVPLVRIEDGFLRSVGLGANFVPAVSIIADRQGVYYDPSRPSDFINLANDAKLDSVLLARARNLIDLLVDRGITKYNTGTSLQTLQTPAGARRILVPGQVEDDRSVLAAGAGVNGNLDLLQRVRASNQHAFIVYKPHPDVDAGHRKGFVPDDKIRQFADVILRDVSSAELILAVDAVHTLTSLAGFEALLRGREVVAHGQPFYAGWGLTKDLAPRMASRLRKLSLEELVAVTLILYPRYLDPVSRLPCGPELIIERLGQSELWQPGMLVRVRRIYGSLAATFRRHRAALRGTRAV